MKTAIIGVIMFVVLCLVAIWLIAAGYQDRVDSFKQHCVEAGGHVYNPAIVLCVDNDGRVVEVYP